ncbi:MAG: energy-coupling factor transporter ATPase [Bacillota bacterium]|nr:energy-coupling factor transporter ATPase [Bacillota bacterium]MDI7249860.1 energy-coupling factor transporter ATPase [Bacillota bacterium]
MRVAGLGHRYRAGENREVEALRGVDLEVGRGEFLAVIGENGSGKSTLAKHFNALLLPTEGEVWVDGMNTRDPACLWEIRRRVGMVFQNPDNQLVATTVEEDVAFGPENLGLPPGEIRARVDEALAAVGMSAFARHAPHLLSGGQKQRVAIAGVLAMRPACLVLDEPTAMLDPVGRRDVLATVLRLNREEKITVVYVTHFMDEAARADRVAVLHRGRVVALEPPAKLFARAPDLRRWGLDVPAVAELAWRLRRRGWQLDGTVLTPEDLVAALGAR